MVTSRSPEAIHRDFPDELHHVTDLAENKENIFHNLGSRLQRLAKFIEASLIRDNLRTYRVGYYGVWHTQDLQSLTPF